MQKPRELVASGVWPLAVFLATPQQGVRRAGGSPSFEDAIAFRSQKGVVV
jgi:hypothetical protein